ncbi:MAG: OmpH family outer membrane protein [Gammaproteobacteria bacterium]
MRIVSAFALALLVTNAFAHDFKIGYIDIEEIISNTPQYQQDIGVINEQFQQTKGELLALFDHVKLLKDSLTFIDKDTQTEEYNKKLNNLSKLELYFQQETIAWNERLNTEKIAVIKRIEIFINKIIKKYGIDEEFDIIFYQNVAFVSDEIDITQLIINKMQESSE